MNKENSAMNMQKTATHDQQKGQSLVELALFLPIFLVIIAGVVEISQLVITQNRVTDATRASTRFAANGGEDIGMVNVVLNTVTQTLIAEDSVWDIWSIRASLNDTGTDFDDWEIAHIYGYSNTKKSREFNVGALQAQILDEIQLDHEGTRNAENAEDLRIVGTYAIHDVESILGLEAVPALAGFNSISELNVVRITGLQVSQTSGCAAFPIAVSDGQRSVTPEGSGSNPFPAAGEFEYPTLPPDYQSFVGHQPDVALNTDANLEGTLFKVTRGWNFAGQEFGWLKWNIGISNGDPIDLTNSLTWPGNTKDYSNHGDAGNQAAAGYAHVVRGYAKPTSADDLELHIGDWVAGSTATLADIEPIIKKSINQTIDMRVILSDTAVESSPYTATGHYEVKEFAIFRIIGYGNTAGNEWLLLQFIRKDGSCGQT